ncbi:hypothetical protein Efla_002480 [Eimeria flavescens]
MLASAAVRLCSAATRNRYFWGCTQPPPPNVSAAAAAPAAAFFVGGGGGGEAEKASSEPRLCLLQQGGRDQRVMMSAGRSSFRSPLLFVDCEMTGLDHEKDQLLEFACILTDGRLQQQVEGPHHVLRCPREKLEAMNSWCREHHGRSGLSAACASSSIEAKDTEAAVLQFLQEHHVQPKEAFLAGNSVHVDRQFLLREMPRLMEYLHYRIVDVSTVKVLANAWFPLMPNYKKRATHRALDDIRESIAELRHYKTHIFRPN